MWSGAITMVWAGVVYFEEKCLASRFLGVWRIEPIFFDSQT